MGILKLCILEFLLKLSNLLLHTLLICLKFVNALEVILQQFYLSLELDYLLILLVYLFPVLLVVTLDLEVLLLNASQLSQLVH